MHAFLLCRWLPLCLCPFTDALALNFSFSLSFSFSLLQTFTNVQPLLTLAKHLSEQMTKTKMVTSFLPTSPMFSVMVPINHTKLHCTWGSLFFLPLPPTGPLSTLSANGVLFCADGFLMAKLKHTADGSLHLLQPVTQLMAVLMTKAAGVRSFRNQWRVGVWNNRFLMFNYFCQEGYIFTHICLLVFFPLEG